MASKLQVRERSETSSTQQDSRDSVVPVPESTPTQTVTGSAQARLDALADARTLELLIGGNVSDLRFARYHGELAAICLRENGNPDFAQMHAEDAAHLVFNAVPALRG